MGKDDKLKCTKCGKPVLKGSTLCPDHDRLKKQADAKIEQDKKNIAAKADEVAKKKKDAEAAVLKKQKYDTERAAKIREFAVTFNHAIDVIVNQVLAARHTHNNPNINAGKNTGLADIPGGTGNPLALALPSNTYKIEKSDICPHLSGFENSDSGYFKYRRHEVFVHCK